MWSCTSNYFWANVQYCTKEPSRAVAIWSVAGRLAACRPPKGRADMSTRQRKTRTILHFSCDDNALLMRTEFLRRQGYRVLSSSNGFETMDLCSRERVDAVVLDVDHNHAEVALIAREIKQRRPQVRTIVLAESPAEVDGVRELADAVVPKEDPELVKSLQRLVDGLTGCGETPAPKPQPSNPNA